MYEVGEKVVVVKRPREYDARRRYSKNPLRIYQIVRITRSTTYICALLNKNGHRTCANWVYFSEDEIGPIFEEGFNIKDLL